MTHPNKTPKRTGRVLPPLPVDRGWAWLIMLAAYVNLMVGIAFVRSLSILLPHILNRYQEAATVTTLAFGISDLSWSITNIAIPTLLLPRFSVRSLALVGSLFHCLSVFALAYSPNIITFNCIFGVIGSSAGLMIVPSLIHLGHFFKKRLSFSNAFPHTGGSVATVYAPLLTQYLLDTYGFQGALLILSAIGFHCVAVSMLLRPLSMYDHGDNLEKQNGHLSARETFLDLDNIQLEIQTVNDSGDDDRETNELSNFLENGQVKNNKLTITRSPCDIKITQSVQIINDNTHHALVEDTKETEKLLSKFESDLIESTISDTTISHQTSIANLNHRNSVSSSKGDTISNFDGSLKPTNLENDHIYSATSGKGELSNNGHSKGLTRAPDFDIELSAKCKQTEHECNQTDPIVDKESNLLDNDASAPSGRGWSIAKIRRNLRSSVLLNPVAVMLILAGGLSTPGGNMYMPVLGLENGLTPEEVPWLLTIIGVADIVGKIGLGYFADLGYLRPIHLASLAQIIVGLTCQFTMYYKGFGAMAAMAAVFGLTGGICQAFITPMIIEMVGLQYLGQVTPIYFLMSGVSTFIVNIAFGAIRDATGSFIGGFNFLGGILLLSLTILLLEPVFVWCRDRSSKSKNSQKDT